MRAALLRDDATESDRSTIGFALAKALDDAGDPAGALDTRPGQCRLAAPVELGWPGVFDPGRWGRRRVRAASGRAGPRARTRSRFCRRSPALRRHPDGTDSRHAFFRGGYRRAARSATSAGRGIPPAQQAVFAVGGRDAARRSGAAGMTLPRAHGSLAARSAHGRRQTARQLDLYQSHSRDAAISACCVVPARSARNMLFLLSATPRETLILLRCRQVHLPNGVQTMPNQLTLATQADGRIPGRDGQGRAVV
jgi:hypothetical protein